MVIRGKRQVPAWAQIHADSPRGFREELPFWLGGLNAKWGEFVAAQVAAGATWEQFDSIHLKPYLNGILPEFNKLFNTDLIEAWRNEVRPFIWKWRNAGKGTELGSQFWYACEGLKSRLIASIELPNDVRIEFREANYAKPLFLPFGFRIDFIDVVIQGLLDSPSSRFKSSRTELAEPSSVGDRAFWVAAMEVLGQEHLALVILATSENDDLGQCGVVWILVSGVPIELNLILPAARLDSEWGHLPTVIGYAKQKNLLFNAWRDGDR